NVLNRPTFLEYDKCPACYGFKACSSIKNGEILVDQSSSLNGLFYSNQHIIHGKHVNGIDVIISKLGGQHNTKAWEEKICTKAKKKQQCYISEAAKELFPKSGSKWILEAVRGQSMMTACPTERLISAITFRYTEMLDSIDISNTERIQLVLTIWRNQEPIIYQIFSKSTDWPFPQYLGACGRVVVYENPGKPLYTFYDEPWNFRIRLALKLLNIAHKFTFNPSQYGIYMMKVGADTFHYKQETKELFYTSARNILIVDKWQLEENKKENLVSNSDITKKCKHDEHWPSTTKNLCNGLYSDHNYYAVCRNILSPVNTEAGGSNAGLLHDVPHNVDTLFGLSHLMQSCLSPK
ncbi:hypothetical protein HELRODRAFT_132750, partial [Helobdella robusta]|uniref:FAM69 protein-kinase domain-containing protein n=1 Tax=Helobdella robusta TaxID=6412 RepID=T1EHZ4_HELRO